MVFRVLKNMIWKSIEVRFGVIYMKSKIFTKTLAVVLLLQLLGGSVPVQAFALDNGSSPAVTFDGTSESTSEEGISETPHDTEQESDEQTAAGGEGSSSAGDTAEYEGSSAEGGTAEGEGTPAEDDTTEGEDGQDDPDETYLPDGSDDQDIAAESDDPAASLPDEDEADAAKEQESDLSDRKGMLKASPSKPAAPGKYILWFQMYGADNWADYFGESIRVYDSDGNQIGGRLTFDQADEGNKQEDRWNLKHIRASFDRAPATIEIRVSYTRIGLDDTPSELVYEAPFEINYDGTDASAPRYDDPSWMIEFCRYGIESEEPDAPLYYVDQYGNSHVQEDYLVFNGLLEGEVGKETWFALRSNEKVQALSVKGDVNLVLCDNLSLESDEGIFIYPNSSLTIWGQKNGTGSLSAYGTTPGSATPFEHYSGAPGIEVADGTALVINGGNITAVAGNAAAGIGSRQDQASGSITINGGKVTAKGGNEVESLVPDLTDKSNGAGIGSGARGSSGPIVINGGTVIAESGTRGVGAAGIGSGSLASSGSITITGGSVSAVGHNYGAGIGSGARASSGPIRISGGTVDATSISGAGIGSGGRYYKSDSNANGSITITGGTISAKSGGTSKDFSGSGAGIGAGSGGPQVGDITISGGVVKAVCTRRSAGIGGSANDDDGFAGGKITIDGEYTKVTALSVGGAGIGSGGRNVGPNSIGANGAPGGNITINNGEVVAASTGAGAGIGGGNGGDGGTITINGGNVKAYGGNSQFKWSEDSSSQPIGLGLRGLSDVVNDLTMDVFYDELSDWIISMLFNDTFSGAGIGGGSHAKGGTVVINGGIVEAAAGTNEAIAIGHGRKNSDNGSLTLYESSKVTYGNYHGDELEEEGVDQSENRHTYAQKNSYARIEPGEVTVSFNVGDHGTAPADQVVIHGNTAKKPADPADEGYFFAGWYTDDTFSELYDFGQPVLRSMTLYAKWITGYTIEIDKEWVGAKLPASVKIYYTLEFTEGMRKNGEIRLTQEGGWKGSILISDECILSLTEDNVKGFRRGDTTLENGTVLPSRASSTAVLNLRNQADSGFTEEEYAAALDLVRGGNASITFRNISTAKYSVKKVWDDDNDRDGIRPDSTTILLLANGTEVDSKTVTAADGWVLTFDDIYKNDGGQEIEYTVEEKTTDTITGTDGPGTYAFDVTGSAQGGFTITNRHTPETIDITGSKEWDDADDQDGMRPDSIIIRLMKGETEVDFKTVTEEDNWRWSFEGLPKYADGEEITYTVTEDAVADYTSEIDGFDIINTHTPRKTQVTVTKAWDDDDNRDGIRPETASVKLLANGADTGKVITLSEDEDWTGVFPDLDVRKGGKDIVYTVEEERTETITGKDEPGAYSIRITGDAQEGFIITNTHTPEVIDIEGSAEWDDADDQDGMRPDSIIIRLMNGETEVDSRTVTEADGWGWTFEGLKKYEDGEEIRYTVSEDRVPGYEAQITGYNVKNTHVPEKKSITGAKTWEDDEDYDGSRPESIIVRLRADGTEIAVKTVTERDDWRWSFEDFPKYADGTEIIYTVTEDAVADYTSEIDGFDITNTHAPGKTQVTVTKVWDDENDRDGIRPETVSVRLLANGADTGKVITLSEDEDWTGVFSDLDVRKGGKDIVYTVEEERTETVTGTDGDITYSISIEGDAVKGFTVTNSHTPVRLYTITYKLNGGTFGGSTADIVQSYPYGTVISIHKAPVRAGYEFLYWKGSEYQPGDEYTVTEDHVLVAWWNKTDVVPPEDSDNPSGNPDNPGGKENTKPDDPGSGSGKGDSSDASSSSAKTGDYSSALTWTMLLASAAAAAAVILKRRRVD